MSKNNVQFFTSHADIGGAKYCDQHVCSMYVYMYVCPLTYLKNHKSILHMAHSFFSGFVDDIMFSHNGANGQNKSGDVVWSSSPGDRIES